MNASNNITSSNATLQNRIQSTPPQPEGGFLLSLNVLPVGCMVLGSDLQIKYWNPATEQILGYSPSEAVGKLPTELIFLNEAGKQFNQAMAEIEKVRNLARVIKSTRKDGNSSLLKWHFTELNTIASGVLAVMESETPATAGVKAEHQWERIKVLRTIDTAISGSTDFQTTLQIILQQTMMQLKMDAVDFLVYEPATNTLKFAAGRGLNTNALQHTNLRIGEGLAGQAALNKKTVRAPDLHQYMQTNFERSPEFFHEGFKSYYCVPLIAKGEVKGVMESFHRVAFNADPEWLEFFETLAGQTAIAIDNAVLFRDLQRSNLDLTLAYDSTLEGWSKALDMRDRDTEGHTRRVTEMTERLARVFGISEAERLHIHRGALLHDIGKMGIPDSILLKESALSEEEWLVMKQHPEMAITMLSSIAFLRPALDIPYCHHEKWDGSGYPRGLKGDQIPLAARIFAVVDVFDALTSDRPYRSAWPAQDALKYIQMEKGKHFDPNVVEVFTREIIGNNPKMG